MSATPLVPWLDPTGALEDRVAAFVADLSPAEKINVALGDRSPFESRGLPAIDYVDAGTGLRGVAGATAFPAGIALAATFDAELAGRYGAAVGAEVRAAGFPVLLGPSLDLARDPRAGRLPEALGEDPYLCGLLGAAHVQGVQDNHVISQLKHFIAYNGDEARTGYGLPERGDAVDCLIPTGMLQDVYLRPFHAAVVAGAWSMMGSYNRVNGEYVCESSRLLSIPRDQWGWQGFYCPDFLFAVRDDAKAARSGLDLPALGGSAGRTADMLTEQDAGETVGRLVRAIIGSGLADDPLPSPEGGPSTTEHRELALECAIASSVLLTNRNHALPLGPEVASIAVIGPSGADAIYTVGGSAAVTLDPERVVSPLEGIRERAGEQCTVISAQGSWGDVPLPIVPAGALRLPDGSGPGVLVTYTDAGGEVVEEVALPSVDLVVPPEDLGVRWPARWRAQLTPHHTGRHRLSLELGGRASVRVNGRTVMRGARELPVFMQGPAYPLQASVDLVAGVPVDLEIEFAVGPAIVVPHLGLGPMLRLGWQQPDTLLDDAVDAAARADAAIVLVTMVSGEGMDRDSLQLPGDQDELVRRVAAVNNRTIVILNTPGAVLLPWADEVAAALQVWYPGETFGTALAAMLFGDAEPGGRLPVTFPKRQRDLPGGDREPAAALSTVDYAADQGIGYRSAAVRTHGAAFPFGFGLSYADSSCELIAVDANGCLRLHLRASTSAARPTVQVVQAYVDLGRRGDAELAAIARLDLAPGGSAATDLEIPLSSFARWDPDTECRRPVTGVHRVRLAQHSADDTGPVITVEITESGFRPISWSLRHPLPEQRPTVVGASQPPASPAADLTEIRDPHAQL